jgi:hypothetical protein
MGSRPAASRSIVTLHVALRDGTEVLVEDSTSREEADQYEAKEAELHIPTKHWRLLLH